MHASSSGAGYSPFSQRFLEFANSELPPVKDDLYLATVSVYAMAWNRAVVPHGSQNAVAITEHIARMPAGARIPLETLHAELIPRKRRMFPEFDRIIADCRPKHAGGIVSLQVLHTDVSHIGALPLPFS
jgi:hypothetical protein